MRLKDAPVGAILRGRNGATWWERTATGAIAAWGPEWPESEFDHAERVWGPFTVWSTPADVGGAL